MQINLVQSKRFDKYHCLLGSLLWLTFSPFFGAMAYDNNNSLRYIPYCKPLLMVICSCVPAYIDALDLTHIDSPQ